MSDKVVLVISARGANDAIRCLMEDYAASIQEVGLSTIQVTTEPAELQYAAELMQKDSVSFAMTWLGIGQSLGIQLGSNQSVANAFEEFGTSLVKLQGDLPAYFLERHSDVPRNSVNLYQADEFVRYRRRWLPEARALTSLIPPMVMTPVDRDRIDFAKRRSGRLFFLKNGNSPAELRSLWRSKLPASVGRLTEALASEITAIGTRAGPLYIGDLVSDFLQNERICTDPPHNLVAFLSAQMDDYLRRVKSSMIAESILDLPVIVQGNFWQHVDFRGRKARLIDGQNVDASQQILQDELGVIDMSPNVDDWPHDRVQRGAGSFALVLTNRQGWLTRRFPEFEELAFEFESESIKARIADVIANPDRYLEQAIAFGERFREIYPRERFANHVIDLAELSTLLWNEPKPALQAFFSWPKR